MIIKTKAIVLRNTNYSESSVISKMYTKELGIRTYLINGVRKPKSKISMAMLQPLTLLMLEAYEKPNANLQRIKELKCQPLLLQIGQDFKKRGVAMYLNELLNSCLRVEDRDEDLFNFLEREIIELENGEEVSNFSLLFMIKFCKELGIDPQGEYSESQPYLDLDSACFTAQSGEHTVSQHISRIISDLKYLDHKQHLNIDSKTRRETLNSLILYYQFHIMKNREMKSLSVLTEVMDAWHTV